jgi:hypothetical protein
VHYGPFESLKLGVHETAFVVERTFDYIGKLVTGREQIKQPDRDRQERHQPDQPADAADARHLARDPGAP